MSELFRGLTESDRLQACDLARHIAIGDWVLFVGSGVSKASGLPLWGDLVSEMIERLRADTALSDPLEVADIFEANLGRNALIQLLLEQTQVPEAEPQAIHSSLLALNPSTVITTNFDDLLERAYAQRNIPTASIVTDADLSLAGSRKLILKPHGDLVRPDSLVFSKRDYARYPQYETLNAKIISLIAERVFLFVGYRLSDPDLNHQIERVIDTQGEFAHYHFLIIDQISEQQRKAYERRHIRPIAIGSYDQLESFLKELAQEVAKRQSTSRNPWPPSMSRHADTLPLDDAEQALLSILEIDYEPVIASFKQLRIADAEHHLQSIWEKIQRIEKSGQFADHMLELKDFRQRVILAFSSLANLRQDDARASEYLQEAENIQLFKEDRCIQAAELYLSQGYYLKVQELLHDVPDRGSKRAKELLDIATLLQGSENKIKQRLMQEHQGSLDFMIEYLRLSIETLEIHHISRVNDLFEKVFALSETSPLQLIVVMDMAKQFLLRIVNESWITPNLNRRKFLNKIRKLFRKARRAFEPLSEQYPEGFSTVLSIECDFYSWLKENENFSKSWKELQKISIINRGKSILESRIGKIRLEKDEIEALFQRNQISLSERDKLLGYLAEQKGEYDEAEFSSEGPLRPLMQGAFYHHQGDIESALTTLRSALLRHPRDVRLLDKAISLLSLVAQSDVSVLGEALSYAERLESILPCPEHTLLRVELLNLQQSFAEALSLINQVDQDGYSTYRSGELKAILLCELEQFREGAEAWKALRKTYGEQGYLGFNEGLAREKSGDFDRAIEVWEDALNHDQVDGNLYLALGRAYILRGAADSNAFSRAFDLFKEAIDKFPDQHEFPVLLFQAGEGAGRGAEAWQIMGRLDLSANPYLRAISPEQGLEILRTSTQSRQALERFYEVGLIPFSVYLKDSPREAAFLWQAKIHTWQKQDRWPIFCGFPNPSVDREDVSRFPSSVLLDVTALLTLGSLRATRSILQALTQNDCQVYLLAGTREWLNSELRRLSFAQMPMHREQLRKLRNILRSSRERVEIIDSATLSQQGRVYADDMEIAVDRGIYYLHDGDDNALADKTVIHSADLLLALEQMGFVPAEVAERIRNDHPKPFRDPAMHIDMHLDQPIMFSKFALEDWYRAELLEDWLNEDAGWTLQIIIGPQAYAFIDQKVTESDIYRAAFEWARDLQAAIEDAVRSGAVAELPQATPLALAGGSQWTGLMASAVALLSQAQANELTIWADDAFLKLMHSPRGWLFPEAIEDSWLGTLKSIQQAFKRVQTVGTEDVLRYLESCESISHRQRMDYLWQLHQNGYRFLDISELLPELLQRFNFNLQAQPIASWLKSLETGLQLCPSGVETKNFESRFLLYASEMFARSIAAACYLDNFHIELNKHQAIIDDLTSRCETMLPETWSIARQWFWQTLILQGVLRKSESLHNDRAILERFPGVFNHILVAYPAQKHREIIREVETIIISIFSSIRRRANMSQELVNRAISTLVKTFFTEAYLKDFNPTFWRLIGYIFGKGLDVKIRKPIPCSTGETIQWEVDDIEIEYEACQVLEQVLSGEKPAVLTHLSPMSMSFFSQIDPDGVHKNYLGDDFKGVHCKIPMIPLPFFANASLRQVLLNAFQKRFEDLEPPLGRLLRELEPQISSEDQAESDEALTLFYDNYLQSTHFQLCRDLVTGFTHIAQMPWGHLSALCGPMPDWPQESEWYPIFNTISQASQEHHESSPPEEWNNIDILIQPSRRLFEYSTLSERIFQMTSEEDRIILLALWAKKAKLVEDVFSALESLAALVDLSQRLDQLTIVYEKKEKKLQDWLIDHLLDTLLAHGHQSISQSFDQQQKTSEPTSPLVYFSPDFEQSVHARVLRLIFRAVASPTHMLELEVSQPNASNQHICQEFMMRGIVLTHRLLPIILEDVALSSTDFAHKLAEAETQLISLWGRLELKDQFCPELYGPNEDQYDHLLAGTLAIFREVGMRHEAGTVKPFWLTPAVKRALTALAGRPENEAEQSIRKLREQGVPNRLQTFLDKTPQEYAAEILRLTSPEDVNENSLINQVRDKLREVLSPATEALDINIEASPDRSDRPDIIVRAKTAGKEKTILIEAKTLAAPRHLRPAIQQLQQYRERYDDAYGVIAAPAISERSRALCEDHGVGYLDLQGNAYIQFDSIFIRTAATAKRPRRPGRAKSLFAPVSTRVIRALLVEPERQWKLSELAETANVSLGQVYKVKQQLLDQEFITEHDKKRLALKDASGLLDAWREAYSYDKNRITPLFSLDQLPGIEAQVKQYCQDHSIRYALTLFSGASKLAPFVRQGVSSFYIFGDPQSLIRDLNLKSVDSGANIILLSPYDEGILYKLQDVEGYKAVSTAQMYVDLYSYGGRGREQAEFLREKCIGF